MRYKKAVLAVITLAVGISTCIDRAFISHKHPPHIGHYERIAILGEDYMEVFDVRPPAYAVIHVPVRGYQ